jgi:hypothetical protein
MPESITHRKKFRRFIKLAQAVFSLVLLVLEVVRRILDL